MYDCVWNQCQTGDSISDTETSCPINARHTAHGSAPRTRHTARPCQVSVGAIPAPTHPTTQFNLNVGNTTQFYGITFYSTLKNFEGTVSLKVSLKHVTVIYIYMSLNKSWQHIFQPKNKFNSAFLPAPCLVNIHTCQSLLGKMLQGPESRYSHARVTLESR